MDRTRAGRVSLRFGRHWPPPRRSVLALGGSMTEPPRYPQDDEVKVEWKALHIAIIVLSMVVIWPLFFCATDLSKSLPQKFLSIAGLNVDIIGVVVASLKTPFYGNFHDGGKIEVSRANVERKYFQFGMWLIALGFFLQALGTLP